MWRKLSFLVIGAAFAACVVHADDAYDCGTEEVYDCYVEYSPGYGYSRVCDVIIQPAICIDVVDDDPPPRYRPPIVSDTSGGSGGDATGSSGSASAGAAGSAGQGGTSGAGGDGGSAGAPSTGEDFDFPCERDAQCGTGLCIDGACFYACEDDTGCGTADVCLAVDAVSVCQPNPEPAIECMRSVECGFEQICMNAACHDSCAETADCTNELDRCLDGVCVPDRRAVSECLLDRECPDGSVCIDARCTEL
jgi:hypothetical protein